MEEALVIVGPVAGLAVLIWLVWLQGQIDDPFKDESKIEQQARDLGFSWFPKFRRRRPKPKRSQGGADESE